MSFDYSQRHSVELEAARLISSHLGAKKHLVIRFDMRAIGGSALTSDMEVPKIITKDELRRMNSKTKKTSSVIRHPSPRIPVTYVPARNTIFLSFALGWAEVLHAADIFIGANAVDYSGYPDCRPEYLSAFESMANLATKASVEGNLRFTIHAPLLSMKKSEIILQGHQLGLDYSLTWSCYDPQPSKSYRSKIKDLKSTTKVSHLIPCGRCDSCLFRANGFREAGIPDPLFMHE